MDTDKVILDERIVSWKELTEIVNSLNVLKLEFDIEKRYVDELRAQVVGLAQYKITLYARNKDERVRFE